MKTKKLALSALGLCMLICCSAFAQSWKWAVRGGAPDNGINIYPYEDVVDMATDSHGNVYVLAILESSPIPFLGDTALVGYGTRDIMFTSYSCNGTMRFHKLIGNYQTDVPAAICIDHADHVYITGHISAEGSYPTVFANDTTLPLSNEKSVFLARYDTSGHLDWLRMPTSDTAYVFTNFATKTYDLMVGNDGNVYWLTYLFPGQLVPGSFVIDSAAVYILKYNPAGTLLQVIRPPLNWSNTTFAGSTNIRIRMFPTLNGNVIFSGDADYSGGPPTFSMGGVLQSQMSFTAEVSLADGNIIWQHHSDSAGFIGRPVRDELGNLYFAGSGVNNGSFVGYTFSNSLSGSVCPMIAKLDSAGHLIWASNGLTNALSGPAGIAVRGSEVVIAGYYPGTVKWQGKQWTNPPNTGFDLFIAHFDRFTGNILAIDSVKSPTGWDDYASAIVSNSRGDIFVGGKLSAQLNFGSLPPVMSNGGDYDFYFACWGADCDCTLPVSAFHATATGGSHFNFTYSGTSPVDSVRWSFGDGTTAVGNTAAHTYTATGTHTVCATAYTSCGIDDTCMVINPLAIYSTAIPQLHIYPDPASEWLTVEGVSAGTATLTNAVGQVVARQVVSGTSCRLSVATYPAGIYTLVITGNDGSRRSAQVVITR